MHDTLYVSVHVPKTGGSTLREILRQKFGDKLQLVYDKRDGHLIIRNPLCIHGHGYSDFSSLITSHANVKWITFLRDPLSAAISMYYFLKGSHRNHRGEKSVFDDPGLEKWLTYPGPFRWPNPPGPNHNRYTKWFDTRPISEFDFVGLTEHFDESLLVLYREFEWEPLLYERINVGSYAEPQLSSDVKDRFKELNTDDYGLYDKAMTSLDCRKHMYGSGFEEDLAEFRRSLGSNPNS